MLKSPLTLVLKLDILAKKHGPFTGFLPKPAKKESNVPKLISYKEHTVIKYILCIAAC